MEQTGTERKPVNPVATSSRANGHHETTSMNIRGLRYILHTLLPGAVLGGLLSGCSADGEEIPGEAPDTGRGTLTVVLRVPLADSPLLSRSDPEAGEDGNGREKGILNENTVHDVNVFFYIGSGLNPANTGATVAGIFVPDLTGASVTEEELHNERRITIKLNPATPSLTQNGILTADSEVSFITIINAGTDLSEQITTLSELREFTGFSSTWTSAPASVNAADCDHFVMTTAYDTDPQGYVEIDGVKRSVGSGRLKKSSSGTTGANKPEWTGETTVQRMCARIDVMYNAINVEKADDNMQLRYTVAGVANTTNTVHITNALPVNTMRQPSYLLPKVTATVPTVWTESGLGAISWGGIELTSGSPKRPANYMIEPHTLQKETPADIATLSQWYGDSRASVVATDIKDGLSGLLSEYFSGTLPAKEDRYDCDLMTILGYANENIQSPGQYKSDYLTGIIFRAVYQPRRWYSKTDGNFVYEDKSDDAWAAMTDKSFTRYQPTVADNGITDTEALYFASYSDAYDYSAAHPEQQAILTRFTGGICYYNLWLRHYNDESADPQLSYPMEYAIVRNNIYRVSLSFSGPGDPEPTMREPDTMQSRIYVRKWNLRSEDTPLQF